MRSLGLPLAIDVVCARQTARREQHYQEQRCHREANDDRREHQCLGHRVCVVQQVMRHARADHRLLVDPQAAHAKNEQVDCVRQQGQPHDNLEGARSQQQPDARCRQYPDCEGNDFFHQNSPRAPSVSAGSGLRWLRSDWCARAVRISIVAPTTTANTPMSKNMALGTWTSPMSGTRRCAVCVVRNGYPKANAPSPVATAHSNPVTIQGVERCLICVSTHSVPATMYCAMNAIARTRPATKPPPGSLCPRINTCSATMPAIGSNSRTSTAGTMM